MSTLSPHQTAPCASVKATLSCCMTSSLSQLAQKDPLFGKSAPLPPFPSIYPCPSPLFCPFSPSQQLLYQVIPSVSKLSQKAISTVFPKQKESFPLFSKGTQIF